MKMLENIYIKSIFLFSILSSRMSFTDGHNYWSCTPTATHQRNINTVARHVKSISPTYSNHTYHLTKKERHIYRKMLINSTPYGVQQKENYLTLWQAHAVVPASASVSMDLLHITFGLPCFHLPWSDHWWAYFRILEVKVLIGYHANPISSSWPGFQ